MIGARSYRRVSSGGSPFRSLFDFVQRTGLPRQATEHLIRIGAFDGFGMTRRELLWQLGLLGGGDEWCLHGTGRYQILPRSATVHLPACGRAANLMALRGKSKHGFSEKLRELGFNSVLEFRPYQVRRVIAAAADQRLSAFLRMQQESIHDVVDSSYVFREITASLNVLARCLEDGVDLDLLFEREYGVRYRRFALGCIAFWGKVTTDGQEGFYLPPGQVGDLGYGVDPEALLHAITPDRAHSATQRGDALDQGGRGHIHRLSSAGACIRRLHDGCLCSPA